MGSTQVRAAADPCNQGRVAMRGRHACIERSFEPVWCEGKLRTRTAAGVSLAAPDVDRTRGGSGRRVVGESVNFRFAFNDGDETGGRVSGRAEAKPRQAASQARPNLAKRMRRIE